jgi:hypothetical protein
MCRQLAEKERAVVRRHVVQQDREVVRRHRQKWLRIRMRLGPSSLVIVGGRRRNSFAA